LSRLLSRRPDRLTTLAAAMLFVLATDPLQAWAAGFVLSFSAMLGISLLMPPLERLGARLGNRTGRKILSLLFLSLAAQLGVLLPTAAYFHQLPLYGVFINLLVVPLAGALLTSLSFVTLLC